MHENNDLRLSATDAEVAELLYRGRRLSELSRNDLERLVVDLSKQIIRGREENMRRMRVLSGQRRDDDGSLRWLHDAVLQAEAENARIERKRSWLNRLFRTHVD